MYSILNIPKTIFEENFWKTVHGKSIFRIEQKKENNFYAFHKRGDLFYINASNEYDMLLKLHNNTKIFINDMPIYEEIMIWEGDKDKKWKFETEQEMYEYYVEEILAILRIYDYHYKQLNVIQ